MGGGRGEGVKWESEGGGRGEGVEGREGSEASEGRVKWEGGRRP